MFYHVFAQKTSSVSLVARGVFLFIAQFAWASWAGRALHLFLPAQLALTCLNCLGCPALEQQADWALR